jgi:hypothetical protein
METAPWRPGWLRRCSCGQAPLPPRIIADRLTLRRFDDLTSSSVDFPAVPIMLRSPGHDWRTESGSHVPISDDDSQRRTLPVVTYGISTAWHAPAHHGLMDGAASAVTARFGKVAYWPKGLQRLFCFGGAAGDGGSAGDGGLSILSLMSTCGLASVSSLALGFSPGFFFVGAPGFAA